MLIIQRKDNFKMVNLNSNIKWSEIFYDGAGNFLMCRSYCNAKIFFNDDGCNDKYYC